MVDTASLEAYSLFGGLTSEQIDLIRPLMSFKAFEQGDYIIRENEPNDSIYFILEGSVVVTRRDVHIADIPEGQTFGEMELLDIMPAIASIRAVCTVRVATISNRCVRQVYARDPKAFSLMMMNLARDLSRRLRRMDEQACEDRPPRRQR